MTVDAESRVGRIWRCPDHGTLADQDNGWCHHEDHSPPGRKGDSTQVVPATALAAAERRIEELEGALRKIADGTWVQEQRDHLEAHRWHPFTTAQAFAQDALTPNPDPEESYRYECRPFAEEER